MDHDGDPQNTDSIDEQRENRGGTEDPEVDDPIPGRPPGWTEERPPDSDEGPLGTVSVDEPDPPWLLDALGQLGIYMGVTAVVLTAIGLGSALIDLQPIANIALVLALGLVSVALVFGAAYQAYVSDLLP